MTSALIILAAAATLLALAAYWASRRARRAWQGAEALPAELAGARLWASEKLLRCRWPVNLRGRIDQAWRTRDNRIVAVETKHRRTPRVYASDRLQLSLCAFLLRRRPWRWWSRERVATHGYVRLVTPAGVVYHQVQLLPDEDVVAACDRYLEITRHPQTAHAAAKPALCRPCAYRTDCRYASVTLNGRSA